LIFTGVAGNMSKFQAVFIFLKEEQAA
jgi:hypothetical protein